MSNRIRNTRIDIRRLSPAEAEVWVTVELEVVTSGSELRGKVTGPRCPGVTTVEIAYALLPLTRERQDYALLARVVIPEPNLWTEATPFVYNARVELWEQGQRVDVANVAVGLKQAGR
jgi:Glycosyl hydrolases family 2